VFLAISQHKQLKRLCVSQSSIKSLKADDKSEKWFPLYGENNEEEEEEFDWENWVTKVFVVKT